MYNLAIKKSDSVLYFEEISCAKKNLNWRRKVKYIFPQLDKINTIQSNHYDPNNSYIL